MQQTCSDTACLQQPGLPGAVTMLSWPSTNWSLTSESRLLYESLLLHNHSHTGGYDAATADHRQQSLRQDQGAGRWPHRAAQLLTRQADLSKLPLSRTEPWSGFQATACTLPEWCCSVALHSWVARSHTCTEEIRVAGLQRSRVCPSWLHWGSLPRHGRGACHCAKATYLVSTVLAVQYLQAACFARLALPSAHCLTVPVLWRTDLLLSIGPAFSTEHAGKRL